MSAQFIQSLALIKSAAAFANRESGELAREISDAVVAAAGTVAQGNLGEQFPVSVVQTGSGTSTNIDMNEVLARLEDLAPRLRRLPISGSAVGTGVNVLGEFPRRVAERLCELSGLEFELAPNPFSRLAK